MDERERRRIDDSKTGLEETSRAPVQLVQLSKAGTELRRYLLPQGTTHLGRSLECEVHIPEPWISRHQAEVRVDEGRVILVHRGSNPTAVAGDDIADTRELSQGDEILLAGRIRLRIDIDEGLLAATREPPPDAAGTGEFAVAPAGASAAAPAAESPGPSASGGSVDAGGPLAARYEVVIVGAGPGGLAAGVRAATHGLSHVVLERSALAHTIERFQRGKWVMDEPPRLPLQPELEMPFEASPREAVLAGWRSAAEHAGTVLRIGSEFEVETIASLPDSSQGLALTLVNGTRIEAQNVVLAIGIQGNQRRFEVPGADLPHITYQLDDAAEHSGKRIVVVGAGDAGIENALALAEHDNQVCIVNRRAVFGRAKPRNQLLIEKAIAQRKISAYLEANVERFEPNRIALITNDGEALIDADLVIGRIGATPPRRFLAAIGLEFPSEDPASPPLLDSRYASNVPGLYVIGALGGYPLIKNCMNQGFEVIEGIVGNRVVPADEPELARKLAALSGSVEENLERIQQRVSVLASLSQVQLRDFLFESELRSVKSGEIVYERNDFEDHFYCVLEGKLSAKAPEFLAGGGGGGYTRTSDHAVDSRYGPGDFFGEDGLLSGRRCEETVTALSDCVLVATPSNAMTQLLNSSEAVRREVDEIAVARLLTRFAPSTTLSELLELAKASQLIRLMPGETFCESGEDSKGLLLIRRGAVTVSKEYDGKPVVLEYVQAGNSIGEGSLSSKDGKHAATVAASVLTEGVLLPADTMRAFLAHHPEMRERLSGRAAHWAMLEGRAEARRGGTALFLLDQGLAEATDLLLIDEALCIGCDHCESACANTHQGVSRLDRQAGPSYPTTRGSVLHIPVACRHCENPKCMDDCPPDALRRDPSGEVYIRDNCIGCGNCASNCPYDVIQMQPVGVPKRANLLWRLLFGEPTPSASEASDDESARSIAVKCDLCRELPSNRGGKRGAACVAACPTGAIVRVNPRDYVDEILQ